MSEGKGVAPPTSPIAAGECCRPVRAPFCASRAPLPASQHFWPQKRLCELDDGYYKLDTGVWRQCRNSIPRPRSVVLARSLTQPCSVAFLYCPTGDGPPRAPIKRPAAVGLTADTSRSSPGTPTPSPVVMAKGASAPAGPPRPPSAGGTTSGGSEGRGTDDTGSEDPGKGGAGGSPRPPRGSVADVGQLRSMLSSNLTLTKLYKDRVQLFKLRRTATETGGAGATPDLDDGHDASSPEGSFDTPAMTHLPRGGCVVQTKLGPVQIGVPPETIKDHMSMGSTIPTYYVVPQQRFDARKFINLAEVEFPTFFNFFVLKKRVKLIVTSGGERCVRTFFREALLGPEGDLNVAATEYGDSVPPSDRPDLRKELDWFSRDFANPGKHMEVNTLVDFVRFTDTADSGEADSDTHSGDGEEDDTGLDEDLPDVMRADLGDGVVVEMRRAGKELYYHVIEDGEELARVQDRTVLPDLTPTDTSSFRPFQPPTFGLTFLGTSHGFDPDGQTTGFVIWVNGQGVMVDPPPNSGVLLQMMGIPPRLIDTLVLTHCHADHDAGTLQKVLEEGQVTLMTTPTIVGSFSRKYSALTGIPVTMMKELFRFRAVRVGEMMPVRGAHFRFFYSLHAVPCVGFEVFLGGKSIVYSADTFNDPEGVNKMYEAGVLSAGRRDALLNFPWHDTVVLHEAGVPPIHTPVSYLSSLPEDVKRRLRLVHVAPKSVPGDAGLQLAREGPEHSIRIRVDLPQLTRAVTVLDLLSYVRFLQHLKLTDTRLLLQMSHVKSFSAGETIVRAGPTEPLCAATAEFFMLASGIVQLVVGGGRESTASRGRLSSVASIAAIGAGVHHLTTGNYFPKDLLTVDGTSGPIETVGTAPRGQSLEAVAQTDVQAVVFNAHEFWHFLHSRDSLPTSLTLTSYAAADAIRAHNNALSSLTMRQWKQFRELFTERRFAAGEALWQAGDSANESGAYVVIDGSVSVVKRRSSQELRGGTEALAASGGAGSAKVRRQSFSKKYERGVLLCEFAALQRGSPHFSQVVAASDLQVFHIPRGELLSFVRANPVLLLYISARIVCE